MSKAWASPPTTAQGGRCRQRMHSAVKGVEEIVGEGRVVGSRADPDADEVFLGERMPANGGLVAVGREASAGLPFDLSHVEGSGWPAVEALLDLMPHCFQLGSPGRSAPRSFRVLAHAASKGQDDREVKRRLRRQKSNGDAIRWALAS